VEAEPRRSCCTFCIKKLLKSSSTEDLPIKQRATSNSQSRTPSMSPIKLSRQSPSLNSPVRRKLSLSPSNSLRCNRSITDQNLTYTKNLRSKSHESSVRSNTLAQNERAKDVDHSNRDFFLDKLLKIDSHANEMEKHLGVIEDFLVFELENRYETGLGKSYSLKQLKSDRYELLKRIDLYKHNYMEIKSALHDLASTKFARNSETHNENTNLHRLVEELEFENNVNNAFYGNCVFLI
jgi:hypothetical protein